MTRESGCRTPYFVLAFGLIFLAAVYLYRPPKAVVKINDVGHKSDDVANKAWQDMLYYQPWLKDVSNITHTSGIPVELPEVPLKKARLFRYKVSPSRSSVLMDLLEKFGEVLDRENITWFISFGSALGSYRHHGIIPWDDDIDVEIPLSQVERVSQVFSKFTEKETNYVFDTRQQNCKVCMKTGVVRHKFYSHSGHKNRVGVFIPYLDVFYYEENSTHVWGDMHPATPTDVIFPLKSRPFCGRSVPCPRDPHRYLTEYLGFKIDDCYTGNYNHMKEMMKPPSIVATVPCSALLRNFTFVTHARGPGGAWCREELVIDGKVVGTHTRSSAGIPVC